MQRNTIKETALRYLSAHTHAMQHETAYTHSHTRTPPQCTSTTHLIESPHIHTRRMPSSLNVTIKHTPLTVEEEEAEDKDKESADDEGEDKDDEESDDEDDSRHACCHVCKQPRFESKPHASTCSIFVSNLPRSGRLGGAGRMATQAKSVSFSTSSCVFVRNGCQKEGGRPWYSSERVAVAGTITTRGATPP